jgi:hypothetical protein
VGELNNAAVSATGDESATWQGTFGAWLGDVIAIGIPSNDLTGLIENNQSDVPVLIAIGVTERAPLEELLTSVIRGQDGNLTTDDSGALVVEGDDPRDPSLRLSDDVLFIAVNGAELPSDDMTTLQDDANFISTMAGMPADDYNIVGYVNAGAYLDAIMTMQDGMMAEVMDQAGMGDMMAAMPDAYRGIAVGFTILSSDHLTADVFANFDYDAVLEASGMGMMPEVGPLDASYLSRVPESAAMAIVSSNLGGSIEQALTSLESVAAMQESMLGDDEFADQIQNLETSLQAVLGLTPEEAFGWATGPFAVSLGFDMGAFPLGLNSTPTRNPLGFGLVAANVDGGAQALFDSVSQLLGNFAGTDMLEVTQKDIVGGQAINIRITMPDVPVPFDLQMAVTDAVFAIGTTDYVQVALEADGGLTVDDAFVRSFETALGDTTTFYYVSPSGIDVVGLALLGQRGTDTGDMLSTFIESANISVGAISADGAAIRMIVTLPPQ